MSYLERLLFIILVGKYSFLLVNKNLVAGKVVILRIYVQGVNSNVNVVKKEISFVIDSSLQSVVELYLKVVFNRCNVSEVDSAFY